MGVDPKNVFVGAPDQKVTGAILTGPETDTIPATIDDFNPAGLLESGYVSDGGVTITPSESTTSIKDWSGAEIRRLLTEFTGDIAWAHLELNPQSARNYFGDDQVQVTAATLSKGTQMRMALGAHVQPRKSWWFKIKDGSRRALVMVPHGSVSQRGEIPLNSTAPVTLPVTLATFPDVNGNNIYIFTDNGVFAATATKTGWAVTVTGAPTGGTYSLAINGTPTAGIAHNAAAAAVAAALNALSGVTGISGITASGSAPITVTFPSAVALTGNGAGLTGGTSPGVTVA
ncbi:phage tail tube protein [Microbacterium sp. No. 7]|uniref:phage tail tube protein n=1 Tax=Microbacterium sp. No. 7 TaxID=1714373 RepID=UPI0006D1E288|nr:hypothetical protein [Microbacterium sp. No. 7]ALJ20378.1 hypothetical protein AOA12_10835 [Microbacterium sp. No. 7]